MRVMERSCCHTLQSCYRPQLLFVTVHVYQVNDPIYQSIVWDEQQQLNANR